MILAQSTILELANAAATPSDRDALIHYANNCLFCPWGRCVECPAKGFAVKIARRYGISTQMYLKPNELN